MQINTNYDNLEQSYLFSTIARKVREYSASHPEADIIRLGIGDVTRPLVPAVIDALHAAVEDQAKQETFHGYGDEQGYDFLHEALVGYYKTHGVELATNEIFISDGAKSDLGNILDIFGKDNVVLVPDPVYPVYVDTNVMAGRKIIFADANEANGFLPLPDASVKCDIIYICSPNNPTGCVYPPELLEKIAEFAIEKEIYVVSDEIYERLIYDGQQHVSIASFGPQIHKQAIVINGLSKTFAMTGWRMGYAAASEDIVNAMAAYQSHATSGANSIAQYASYKALQNGAAYIRAMREEYDARRQLMVAKINGMDGVSCITPHGAFYVMLNVKKLIGRTFRGEKIEDAVALSRMLLDAVNVAVVPGDAFEAPGFCRISYAVSREDIDAGLDAIGRFVGMVE